MTFNNLEIRVIIAADTQVIIQIDLAWVVPLLDLAVEFEVIYIVLRILYLTTFKIHYLTAST